MSEQTKSDNLVPTQAPLNDKEDQEDNKPKKEEIKLTKYRYIIVIIYCLVNFTISVHWISFASCADNFGKL